jgi:hypothetical protein
MTTHIPGCTGKKRYRTDIEAINAAIKTSFKWGKPMRHYRCPHCNGYHVTSEIRNLEPVA